jgi:hypothetical protein
MYRKDSEFDTFQQRVDRGEGLLPFDWGDVTHNEVEDRIGVGIDRIWEPYDRAGCELRSKKEDSYSNSSK